MQNRFSTLRWTVVKFWQIFKMLLYTVVYCAKILFYQSFGCNLCFTHPSVKFKGKS